MDAAEFWESHERQYCELSTSLARKCSQLSAAQGELKKQKLKELNNGLEDAESLIRKMDVEARSLQAPQKVAMLAKLREYKSDLNNLKRDAKNFAANDSASTRDELLESGQRMVATTAEQRARLQAATDKLTQSSDRVKESRRSLLETEQVGVAILQDLHSQRQTLLHAQGKLYEVDENISQSRQVLNSMSRRIHRNKYTIWGIIGVLVVIIFLILYFKWRSH